MAMALVASGQTNLTPEQEAARVERQQRAREMSDKLLQATIKAQQRAASNQAARPMPVKGFGEEQFVTPLYRTNRSPLMNPNSKLPIQALEFIEQEFPGTITNLTADQLYDPRTNATVNQTREYFRNARQLPTNILSTGTNFQQKLEDWKTEQFQEQEYHKTPSGGGDLNWTNSGVDWWSLEFDLKPWSTPPAYPYYEPGTTNLTFDPIRATFAFQYATIYHTNRILRFTNSVATVSLPDYEGLFGVFTVRYPEICWLPDPESFTCVTGRLYGVRSGSAVPFYHGDRALMSGGYIAGAWTFVPSISQHGVTTSTSFSINWQALYPPTKATFFAPPFSQGPMIEPVGVPSEPPVNLPPKMVHAFGAGFSRHQVETSPDLVNWTIFTNAVTDETGVLSVELPDTNATLFVRSAALPN